jgi:predicted Zn-dependent protease with MMP-like domain
MSLSSVLVRLVVTGLVASSSAAEDRLKIDGIADGDNVVVMMDARTGSGEDGCENDKISRSTGDSLLGNLRSRERCNSEIAILSANNAMLLETPVTTWTNEAVDVHTSRLKPIIDVPVIVWIANRAASDKAVDDMALANLLYEKNKVGVRFKPTHKNVSDNPDAVRIIKEGIGTSDDGEYECQNIRGLQESAFYVAKTLNVYYIRRAITGRNCAIKSAITMVRGDGNITYIGTSANRATLAHELGHAFGLRPADDGGHTNPGDEHLPGFGPDNIMTGGGKSSRKHFSAGQVFRMNTHADRWGGTMLINNGRRPGPGRNCPPSAENPKCPALKTDWARP